MNPFDNQPALTTTHADPHTGGAIRFATGECSLGSIVVAQGAPGVCAILFGNEPDALAQDPRDHFPHATPVADDPDYERLVAQVACFVDAPGASLDLRLDVRGTVFPQRVWQALCKIPIGSTASYSEIAPRINQPDAARAVAPGLCVEHAGRGDPLRGMQRWRRVRLSLGVERKRTLLACESSP